GLKADRIWFMEMNTRLQVEHPVTEAITGVDLVEWQFRVAAGEPIPLAQADIPMNGWAMEARLYAEDPANGFLPSIGKLDHFVMPEDARVDTGVMQGGEVSQFYDPMIAKLIVHADTREEAAADLADAAAQVEVWPVKTNAGFLVRCLEHPRFVSGDVDTGFIAAEEADLLAGEPDAPVRDAALGLVAETAWTYGDLPRNEDHRGPWESLEPHKTHGFRLNAQPRAAYHADLEGRRITANLRSAQSRDWTWIVQDGERENPVRLSWAPGSIQVSGETFGFTELSEGGAVLFARGDALRVSGWRSKSAAASGPASDGSLRAPMPGKIVAAPAKAGDTVAKGAPIVVLEAMKMEHALTAPFDGVVESVSVSLGDQVGDGVVLAVVKPAG
ncbi:MAG: methylcrotonoyl-CoA carboxylase, partial [Brevundimonas sp.]